jgi:phage/plasmid-associated DNA primase
VRLANAVLDLRELKLLDKSGYYFTYKLNISISAEELKAIKEGSYDVRDNAVYRSWRAHFEDDDWEYLVDSLGAWLAPHRSKLVTFIVGPTNSGKSTLLFNLVKPVEPLVATVSLRSITGYQFGLQALVGKHILAYSERGDVVLKNLDIINNIVGESDFIHVERKHKPAVKIRSLKATLFTMNDPPMLHEQGGETLAAFIERLSLVFMRAPEDFKPVKEYRVPPEEAFKFLLWCRVKLEERGWGIRKRGYEEKLDYLVKMANTALRFLESEYVIPDQNGRVKGTELYDAYVSWCKENGLTPMGRDSFYTAVATKFTKIPPDKTPDKTTWFKGIRVRRK